jgi:4-hydroxy-3-methylbut-2-enyl diphosphate reductase
VAVVAQTTQDLRRLQEVAAACLERFAEVRVFNTICEATAQRQAESRQLARRADLVIVIGGRDSANTGRLVAICGEEQPNTHWVERADELEPGWMAGCERVAVTAGASTPDRVVREVIDKLEQLGARMDHGGETAGRSR